MGHSHAHSTIQTPSCHNRAFGIGIALNVGYIVLEVVLGCLTDSLALLADAGHNLSDVFSLLLAWGAASVGARPPSGRRTYGLRRASILAALANAILLLLAIGAIAWEAVQRFAQPSPVPGVTVMWVAGTGVFINGLTALLFMKGRDRDLNIRGAFLHMAADAGVSLGVVGAGLAMLLTGWLWIDPTVSLLIVIVVAVGTWGLLRDSVNLALDTIHGWTMLCWARRRPDCVSGSALAMSRSRWKPATSSTPAGRPARDRYDRTNRRNSELCFAR